MPATPRLRGVNESGAADFLLTPSAQAALFGLNAIHTNLLIWRRVTDSMRESVRRQQDAVLRIVFDRTAGAQEEHVEEGETANGAAANGAAATDFLMPVIAARRAYVQMSGAMIDAQRQALAALVGVNAERPH